MGRARPVANVTIPINGRVAPPVTDAARSVPTNGPTHAKDTSEKVSPMSRVPTNPPLLDDSLRRVRTEEGIVISNAPSKLRPKTMNRVEINPFTHGFDPSWTTPDGPKIPVTPRPRPENRTMIPRQNTT